MRQEIELYLTYHDLFFNIIINPSANLDDQICEMLELANNTTPPDLSDIKIIKVKIYITKYIYIKHSTSIVSFIMHTQFICMMHIYYIVYIMS